MDCLVEDEWACKQLCDSNSGCNSFRMWDKVGSPFSGGGCQLCESDGEDTYPFPGIGIVMYSKSCSDTMQGKCGQRDMHQAPHCGNVLTGANAKGCQEDAMDCLVEDEWACKQLCDANSGCNSFNMWDKGGSLYSDGGCQLCGSDGEDTKPWSGVGIVMYSKSCSDTMQAP